MLAERFNALRARLDALAVGQVATPGLFQRVGRLFVARAKNPPRDALVALDRDLELAGIHTSADAKLLRELTVMRGNLGALGRGLSERALQAQEELEGAVAVAEQESLEGELQPGTLGGLEDDFRRLGRVVKVAAVFAAPETSPAFERYVPATSRLGPPPQNPRLAVAEFLAERARLTTEDTARKRRDVDLAYELVLRLSAEERKDRDRVRTLRHELVAARERVRSSPAVSSFDELLRHVRFTARKDPSMAWRSMRALYERAMEAGDDALGEVAAGAVEALRPRGEGLAKAVERHELARGLGYQEPAGAELPPALKPGGKSGAKDLVGDMLAELAFSLDPDERRALQVASGAARFFDVEDSLGEELVQAETDAKKPAPRRVPYPTQLLAFDATSSLDELHNFVISRPGVANVVLDLASNRQLVRSYLEEVPPEKKKAIRKTAVRVYVLDASGSMHGARARFRDAILVAELNAIRVKAKLGLPFDPLYFSYFNDEPTELTRVDSGVEAAAQIETLLGKSPAEGQTDITLALASAFDAIAIARTSDPYLARATAVLVTDGEDGVDLEAIRRHQRPLETVEIALSFISLGEENPDLKSLVLEQRARGTRAFYHHLSDAELVLAPTEFDSAWRTVLPMDVPVTPEALERLAPHLEALENIARQRPVVAPERLDEQFDALFPAVPVPTAKPGPLAPRVADLLEAVSEAASLAPADVRASEAALLLTHLLGMYAISTARYLEEVQAMDARVGPALKRLRLLCRPQG